MKKNRLPRKADHRHERRFDRPGHIDPAHAARLLDLSGSGRGRRASVEFIGGRDELGERLATSAVRKMTLGSEAFFEELDEQAVPEGGPFVVHALSDAWQDEIPAFDPLRPDHESMAASLASSSAQSSVSDDADEAVTTDSAEQASDLVAAASASEPEGEQSSAPPLPRTVHPGGRVVSKLFKKIPPMSDIMSWVKDRADDMKSRAEATTHKFQDWSRTQLARTSPRRRPV